jgi:hypothetical protein
VFELAYVLTEFKVTENSRPEPVHFGDDFERDMLWLYYNSSKAPKDLRYIKWVFGLRHTDHRYALQIVEGWSPLRIAVAGSLPAVISTIVGVAWSARAGDVVTGFTVALFILTAGTRKLTLRRSLITPQLTPA